MDNAHLTEGPQAAMGPVPKGSIERDQHNKRSEIPHIARFAPRALEPPALASQALSCMHIPAQPHPLPKYSSARHTQALKKEKENAAEEPWIVVMRAKRLAYDGRDQPKQHEGEGKRYEQAGWKTSADEGDR